MTYSLINNGDTGLDVRNTLNGVINEINSEGIYSGTFSISGATTSVIGTIDFSGASSVLIEGTLLGYDSANELTYGNQFFGVYSGTNLDSVNTADQYIKTSFDTVTLSISGTSSVLSLSLTGQTGSDINGNWRIKSIIQS